MTKNEIRVIYKELQGYLSQIPLPRETYDTVDDKSIWEQVNQVIDELNQVTEKDYTRFKVEPWKDQYNSEMLRVTTLRLKLGGLISRLHAEFFNSEPEPFSGSPSTVISQHQEQNQKLNVQIITELKEKIREKENEYESGSKEKIFLDQFKNKLEEIKDANSLILLILNIASSIGLSVSKIIDIFK